MKDVLCILVGGSAGFSLWCWMASMKNRALKDWLSSDSVRGMRPNKLRSMLNHFKNRDRGQLLLKDLPDFLDVFAMTSGVCGGFEASFRTALHLLPSGPLKDDLGALDKRVALGQTRERSLDEFINGCSSPNLRGVFKVIKQAVHHGSPLAEVIRAQAASLREDRLMQLEKEAHTAGLKLLLPILIFIFPTIFLLLFGGIWLNAQAMGSWVF